MRELVTCQGRYRAGEPVWLRLCHDTRADRLLWRVTHLAQELLFGEEALSARDMRFALPPLAAGGYGVEARLMQGNAELARLYTAVNVEGRAVRYGFLSDFGPEDEQDIEALAKYHIDHVQFYDWSWRHDTLVAPEEDYQDMMGKRNSKAAIRQKIHACHQRGMLAMAYGAVYAASRPFWEQHPSWGLYGPEGKPMTFIDTFYYMDLESPWRQHLMEQYLDAVRRMGFDGIHMDTYGEPKTARAADGSLRHLEDDFPGLIADTRAAFQQAGLEPHLVFNNVGAWPVEATRQVPQDAVYMELWPPMDRYRHLRQAVQLAGDAQPVVLAAYPAPFRTDTPSRALHSQRFLSFAIALLGATQLFVGEKDAVVTQGYYADYSPLNRQQRYWVKAYQDFFVRYGDLLYNPALKDVTLTHCGGDNTEYRFDFPFSVDGEPGKVWLTLRESRRYQLIGLINLCGNRDDHWNQGKTAPRPQTGLVCHVQTCAEPTGLWYATPDEGDGCPAALPWQTRLENGGTVLSFRLPRLTHCGMVWLERPQEE